MAHGYYLTTPAGLVTLPTPRPDSDLYGNDEHAIVLPTEHGVKWVYAQSRPRVFRLVFQLTVAQLAILQTLEDAVEGQRTVFYYVPDTSTPNTAILVRKEQGFHPRAQRDLALVAGERTQLYDYTLELTEEITAAAVTL